MQRPSLPIRSPLGPHYVVSGALALCTIAAAVMGLASPEHIYFRDTLKVAYMPTDIVTLALGLPYLLLAMFAAMRRSLLGLLAWPGALFYLVYTYVPYLLDVPFGPAWPLYASVIGLGTYGLAALLGTIDGEDVANRFGYEAVVRPAAGVAVGLGVFLLLRTGGLVAIELSGGTAPRGSDLGLWATDALVAAPALFISGAALWGKRPFGYKAAPGVLFAYFLLVVGVIPIYIAQTRRDAGGLDVVGVVILAAMALACALPLWTMLKGLATSEN